MNGAVYISFFQGQLESVLEQVVQLAVQEISKSVGSSLNALLLETAVKEQENRRLRLQLQSWENRDGSAGGTERADSGRTKAQQQQQQQLQQPELRVPGGPGAESGAPSDTRRLEHKGRIVDQLKSVMEKVLDFAVCELTKIVEASYDDLLLEITKMEQERLQLEERLDRGEQCSGGRRHGSENDSVSPSGSEEIREDTCDVTVSKKQVQGTVPPCVQSNPQDWVPILDKVFGEKWSDDSWPIEEKGVKGGDQRESRTPQQKSLSLEPAPYSPQQDPRWTPLEDMEVFSPDVENGLQNSAEGTRPPVPGSSGSGQSSSASMLQRLLTLPSQLLDEDPGKETLVPQTKDSSNESPAPLPPPLATTKESEEDEGEEGEEEDKGRKRKRRRVWSECEDCGRRFSRVSQLKSHRLTHATASDWVPSPPGPPSSSPPLQCSKCGKRFSSATRLHSHMKTLHPGDET